MLINRGPTSLSVQICDSDWTVPQVFLKMLLKISINRCGSSSFCLRSFFVIITPNCRQMSIFSRILCFVVQCLKLPGNYLCHHTYCMAFHTVSLWIPPHNLTQSHTHTHAHAGLSLLSFSPLTQPFSIRGQGSAQAYIVRAGRTWGVNTEVLWWSCDQFFPANESWTDKYIVFKEQGKFLHGCQVEERKQGELYLWEIISINW